MWKSFENIGLQTSEEVSWEKKKQAQNIRSTVHRTGDLIIGLSRCVSTGVAWLDGRSRVAGARQEQAASGELRARIDGSGGGGGVAY